ncbi:MAG TPA: sulfatase-like hydrolase/transferase [Coxiellaceae bacterium]|nr:sulfatase-like hydrolase/transferase [Coxiellaceae bacterium]
MIKRNFLNITRYFLANSFFYLLMGTSFLWVSPNLSQVPYLEFKGKAVIITFIVTSYIGHYFLISVLGGLFTFLVSMMVRKPLAVKIVAILVASSLALFLISDVIVYYHYHFHLNGVVWQMLKTGALGEVLVLSSKEWGIIVLLVMAIILLESFLAQKIFDRQKFFKLRQTVVILTACLFLSYVLMTEAYAQNSQRPKLLQTAHLIIMEAQLIPFYDAILGTVSLKGRGGLKLQTRGSGLFYQLKQVNYPLNYPLHPLRCTPQHLPNILFIVLDDWRFDMMNPIVTPNIYAFSKKTLEFKDHYTGGNATGPGIFSLFYSVPYPYWTAMLDQHHGPVFIHQLLEDHYEMGIYRSASLRFPAFNKTVFQEISNLPLKTPGSTSYVRDQAITNEFSNFLKYHSPEKPFFGFVFYDASHNYCESIPQYQKPFKPAIEVCDRIGLNNHTPRDPYLNRYKNAIHYVDGLVGRLLNQLETQGMLDNTIVIITADHGEQFNEDGHNLWGHANSYTNWQLHVPFMIYWPKKSPQVFSHFTTHYDVMPYLIQNALNCQNPSEDYSVGASLLKSGQRPFFLVGSYIDYAILTDNTATRIYPQGEYAVIDRAKNKNLMQTPDKAVLKHSFLQLKRYFKQ